MNHIFIWTFKDVVGLTILGLILTVVIAVVLWGAAKSAAKKARKFFNR